MERTLEVHHRLIRLASSGILIDGLGKSVGVSKKFCHISISMVVGSYPAASSS
jgi:hypothetical protein